MTDSDTLRHRHLVALPMFIVAVLCVAMLGHGSLTSANVGMTDYERIDTTSDATVTFPNSSVRALIYKGSFFEFWNARPILRDGSLLVGSKGLTTVFADRAEIRGIDGAFYVSLSNNVLTVAAITTPVSVRIGQESLAIPVGTQWRSPKTDLAGREEGWERWLTMRRPIAVPRAFLVDMQNTWRSLPQVEELQEAAQRRGSLWTFPWQFSAAKERSQNSWQQALFDNLSKIVGNQDSASLQAFLTNNDIREAIEASEDRSVVIPSLIGRAETPSMVTTLLPFVHGDRDTILLTSLHPALRSAVWSNAPAADVTNDSDLLRITMLPYSDTGEDAISPVLLDQWQQEFQGVLDQMGQNQGIFLSAYFPGMLELVHQFESTGYPERAQHYRAFVEKFGTAYQTSLTPGMQSLLAAMQLQQMIMPTALSPAAPAVAPTAAAPVKISKGANVSSATAASLGTQARDALQKAGAAFSVKTSMGAVNSSSVQVTGIVFGSKKGDRSFDFLWNLQTGEVSNVVAAGKKMPFPMQFTDFVSWAKGK